ncbi:MAG: hypothetical protein LBQ78_06940 [Tannerellaceae bacterium]|jgi:hypothetical protein|nr:hypothetical protein [Tannerellaceae bacterium]
MKNLRGIIILYAVLSFVPVGCGDDVDQLPMIPMEDITNEDFKSYLLSNFDIDKDGFISVAEAEAVTEMHCDVNSESFTMDGIQHFTNLRALKLTSTPQSLDLSKNTKLEELYCTGMRFSALDFSGNPSLKILDCSYNTDLASLNLSKCTMLESLSIADCNISTLDLSPCKALKVLYCNDLEGITLAESVKLDELKTSGRAKSYVLDIRGMNISKLDCAGSAVTSVIASGNAYLKEVIADNCTSLITFVADDSGVESVSLDMMNGSSLVLLDLKNCDKLKNLNLHVYDKYGKRSEANADVDISGCTALASLEINYTNKLNVTGCTALKAIDCFGQISSVNLNGCSAIERLIFYEWSKLSSLDVSDCKALKSLYGYGTFSTLDLSANIVLDSLVCAVPLTDFKIDHLTKLRYLSMNSVALPTFNMSNNQSIEELEIINVGSVDPYVLCDVNVSGALSLRRIVFNKPFSASFLNVKSLNAERCTSLESLDLNTPNNIETLNIQSCSSLKTVSISSSQLTSLDLSEFTRLDSVCATNTPLQSVEVSKSIRVLDFQNNNALFTLNVSGCQSLETLICSNSALSSLSLNQCTSLKTLECTGNSLASLDVSACTFLENFYCFNNVLSGSIDVSKCKRLTRLDCRENTNLTKLMVYKNHFITNLAKDPQTVLELVD